MAKSTSSRKQLPKVSWEFPLHKKNGMILLAGLATIVLGYVLMYTGNTDDPALYQTTWNNSLAIEVAPLVLVIGYCVIIPFGLLKYFRNSEE